jgi:CDP-glycerol glycerophosphotransferase (TagB/SpsB family)
VTDYSSVSFDALFLQKPVFLFQFDQDEMGLKEEAFIDIETQLPGHISFTPEELALSVSEVRAAKWSFVHQPQRELYFDHCDDLNSARISELIRTFAQAN